MPLVAYDDSESDEERPQDLDQEKISRPKQTVKISIPTVNYDSDDEPASKKIKLSNQSRKSGLLSILPPPKVQSEKLLTFIPNVLKKKPTTIPNKNEKVKLSTMEKVKVRKTNDNNKVEESDYSDEDAVSHFDEELWEKIIASSKRKTAFTIPVNKTTDNYLSEYSGNLVSNVQIAPMAEKPYDGLDNNAFKELVGNTKQKDSIINIIDIHEDEIRPDKGDWLKSLTDPNYAPKQEAENPVNDTCKRKHHITYLAQQAKANELELQNQWSQNRFARKQTQAKYGF